MRKPAFQLCKNKGPDQLCRNRKAVWRFCFHHKDCIIPLLFLNQKFQASSHLQWLCDGSSWTPLKQVFLMTGLNNSYKPHLFCRSCCNRLIFICTPEEQIRCVFDDMSLVVRKPVFGISDQVPHKPDCTVTEDS